MKTFLAAFILTLVASNSRAIDCIDLTAQYSRCEDVVKKGQSYNKFHGATDMTIEKSKVFGFPAFTFSFTNYGQQQEYNLMLAHAPQPAGRSITIECNGNMIIENLHADDSTAGRVDSKTIYKKAATSMLITRTVKTALYGVSNSKILCQ